VRKDCQVVVSHDGRSVTWSSSSPPDPDRESVCGRPAVEVSEGGTPMCALHWDAYNEDHYGPATQELFKGVL
jgi:hypothetical protein